MFFPWKEIKQIVLIFENDLIKVRSLTNRFLNDKNRQTEKLNQNGCQSIFLLSQGHICLVTIFCFTGIEKMMRLRMTFECFNYDSCWKWDCLWSTNHWTLFQKILHCMIKYTFYMRIWIYFEVRKMFWLIVFSFNLNE